MSRFIAFDVETPNRLNHRMSAIGITVIDGGVITKDFYTLVDPETHFDWFNTQLTGIDAELVRDAPSFPELWPEIEPLMSGGILLAHNAVFDLGVLKKCLDGYGISWKRSAKYLCTVQMGRQLLPGMSHKLNALCNYYGISLNHHNAGSDSQACARILMRYIEDGADVNRYIRTYLFGG
ncbi:MAG: 3'-5' exonuclease [Butyricicoccus sp.]|nr:3'-5' exonuclease [Butyricicoccus sp.]